MSDDERYAPGWPGIAPRWTSSAKNGVGVALNPQSHVWFTFSHGILNEIYYPRPDLACTRDLGLIVTSKPAFFSEEKRHTQNHVAWLGDGIPAFRLLNTCVQGRYQIEKIILADPHRDVVLQSTRLVPLTGRLTDYELYALLAPHLGNHGSGNTAWLGDYKGVPMLFAQRSGTALALACSVPWVKRSVGFVGVSDGWQDLTQHHEMTWEYTRAENGNVALMGQVDLQANDGAFILAVGFGNSPAEAGEHARASLLAGFEATQAEYVDEWNKWQKTLLPLEYVKQSRRKSPKPDRKLYRISVAVIACHEAIHISGGLIASLSIPWGFAKGDDDLGGYHLAWPRDLAEAAGALVAAGAEGAFRRVLDYLQVTQEADGHWPQNMWLDGIPYWNGIQLDETAFPILLIDLAWRKGMLTSGELKHFWQMVRRAASFIVRNGPVTQQDRWEEDPGYSPFTLAVEVAALLATADIADLCNEADRAVYLRETADTWNSSIEDWTFVTGTDLAHQIGVDGYYVRIRPPEVADAASPKEGFVPIKNRPLEQSQAPAIEIVSPDALALVRFGLRAPDDPRIVNTVQVIDALLCVETPYGPAWRRYNEDGYGEHADGQPFDGTGIGRAWPLLTAERAHYELAAGRRGEAEKLLRTLETFANEGGMIPEQIWDAPDIPARELFFGRPSGSAMPLVWAHAEYVKLSRSLRDGSVFDTPPQPVQRYQRDKIESPYAIWRFNQKRSTIPAGKTLRIESLALAVIHWRIDQQQPDLESKTCDTGWGVYFADLPTKDLPVGTTIHFTFQWLEAERWEGTEFAIRIKDET
jgi:glucoamylase